MRAILSIILAFTAHAAAQAWPTSFSPSPAHAKYQDLGQKGEVYHYRTKHYRIETDQKLKGALLADFVRSIESVASVLERIPLPLSAPPQDDLPKIKTFSSEENFIEAGGIKGAAGYYNGRTQEVLIRWDQFYPPKNGSSRLGANPSFDLLVHELVHLQMHHYLAQTQPWFYEGVAEYLAAAHGKAGNFRFTEIEQSIRDRIKKHTDPEATGIPVTKLSSLISMTSREWHQQTQALSSYELLEHYSASLLLIHYYFHGGEARRNEVKTYLESAQKITRRKQKLPVLLSPQEAEKIQARLVKFWAPRGLKLKFH